MKTETTKHTLGEWEGDRYVLITVPNGENVSVEEITVKSKIGYHGFTTVAYVFGKANARLIAAAPETAAERDRLKEVNAELLEACKRALIYVNAGKPEDMPWASQSSGEHAERHLKAAIAKAEGRA